MSNEDLEGIKVIVIDFHRRSPTHGPGYNHDLRQKRDETSALKVYENFTNGKIEERLRQ